MCSFFRAERGGSDESKSFRLFEIEKKRRRDAQQQQRAEMSMRCL